MLNGLNSHKYILFYYPPPQKFHFHSGNNILIVRYVDVLTVSGIGLGESFHPVAACAADSQQECKGKNEKGRKDIRFSVHRLTTFLLLLM